MRLPTSVIVFGALNLVFGALGLCGTVVNVVMAFVPVQGDDAITRVVRENMATQIYLYVGYGISLLASSWLIASGIGLLLRQPWARTGSVIYGWIAIVQTVLVQGLNYLLLIRPIQLELDKAPISAEERLGMLGVIVGGSICGGALSLCYAAMLIYFMTREHVQRAFGAAPSAAESAAPSPRSETGNPYQSPG